MTARSITVAGRNVHVEEIGDGAPVLYLHGIIDLHGLDAEPTAFHRALASSCRVIAPAHPGCSKTEEDETIETMDDVVFHYLRVMDALGLDKCTLAGSSLGGWIAAEIAVRHPERVDLLPPNTKLLDAVDPAAPYRGERADVVVEATGHGALVEAAIARTRPRGVLVLKTTAAEPAPLNLWQVVVDEIRMVGSRCGRFAPALETLASGVIPLGRFVDATFPLNEGPEAFRRAASPGALKVILHIAG